MFHHKGYLMVKDGLTGTDIFEIIFLIMVVGSGAGWFIYTAVKEEK